MKNNIILITGATSGIGKATAQQLAKDFPKHEIWLTGRRKERLQLLQQEISTDRVRTFCFDIRNRNEVEHFLSENREELNRVSILVNNAGLALGLDSFAEASLDDWEQMIDTNVKGLLYITRGILPYMEEQKNGHIINIGSIAGRAVYPKGHVYNATKFAVRALTEALRIDTLGKNIRVSSIDPGMVETEFALVRFKGEEEKAKSVYQGFNALQAEDIAETISWCLSRPAHVNIQEILIMPTDQATPRDVFRK
ncbi:MAG: SDR family NAD(P)-dependent oxidoreductase [Oligoflexia bacterium]|nr:SDR family NAD(P)-dependent oxidoreductase [Oligoflexia bacterium]